MTIPRPRYALPWPPDCDPPPETVQEPQSSLWQGSCERCAGAGIVALELEGADPDDRYTCPACMGSGLGDVYILRRLRDDTT